MARVLVVDDHDILRAGLALAVRSFGYEVEVASDGQEALERLSETGYDVLLTDLMMPRMDGLELLRRLDEQDGPKLLRIVMTASEVPEMLEAARPLADVVLAKPVRLGQLREILGSSGRAA